MSAPVFILGGSQTDFARHWTREGLTLTAGMGECAEAALADAQIDAGSVDSVHVGNFVAERFCDQGHLGGLVAEAVRGLEGRPASRHEAACASGSIAIAAARAELLAGLADVSLVIGVEVMRNVPGVVAAQHLATAAWVPEETAGIEFFWPTVFSRLGDEYQRRYGLEHRHLAALAQQAFDNARQNPLAQSRRWTFPEGSFTEDDAKNPPIAGRIRRLDCAQITDGAAAVVLANAEYAGAWAARRGMALNAVPRILGAGHRTARIAFEGKLADSADAAYVFPHVKGTFDDALRDAGLQSWRDLDAVEIHDCFTTTFYMAIDHLGLTPPGESWRAIEDDMISRTGVLPFNPGGGLIGLGHPVGATGVRMLRDVARQVAGAAGACQVDGARRAATLNIGGSATTSVSFVVGVG